MRKSIHPIVGLVVSLVAVLAIAIVLDIVFHDRIDSGTFTILQSKDSNAHRVAMLVERPGTKWGGNTFFVVVGDHLYDQRELRKALSGSDVVFETGRGGLEIGWMAEDTLAISCLRCGITNDMIQIRKVTHRNILIKYLDFPD